MTGKIEETLSQTDRCALLEAILFISDRPLTPEFIARTIHRNPDWVREGLEHLRQCLNTSERGLRIRKVHDGYELIADPRWKPYLKALQEARYQIRLSRAALETLAVIAYHQPVTLPEIRKIRGVDSTRACKQLLRLNLIRVVGRKPSPGRPRLYGTTPNFLNLLGLESLDQLIPWETFVDEPLETEFPGAEPIRRIQEALHDEPET